MLLSDNFRSFFFCCDTMNVRLVPIFFAQCRLSSVVTGFLFVKRAVLEGRIHFSSSSSSSSHSSS